MSSIVENSQNNAAQSRQSLNNNQQTAGVGSQEHLRTESSASVVGFNALWQHPYVDVFKHFKVLPVQDWKLNKKQGDVSEQFAREIGRKAMYLNGSISANNFIQIPHPNGIARSLQLTGRYVYLQIKAPVSSAPLAFHLDLAIAERSHGIRISCSNLYKQMSTQNGFVLQLPLNLDINRWTVVVLDLYSLLKMSKLLPSTYLIEACYQIKQMTLCANSMIRGIYTSDNLYDFVTLPPDMRFKFSFEINRWPDYFAWLELPQDYSQTASEKERADDRSQQLKAKAALRTQNQTSHLNEVEKRRMEEEIQNLNQKWRNATQDDDSAVAEVDKRAKYAEMQAEMMAKFGHQAHSGDDLLSPDEKLGYASSITDKKIMNSGQGMNLKGLPATGAYAAGAYESTGSLGLGQYATGQYNDGGLNRSPKLNVDPVVELKHIIGYSPENCKSLKWSRLPRENVCVLSSGGTLIALDVETGKQERFFFGHSAPICCFDISPSGNMIASAQEGENSIIRIWDYNTARCITPLTIPKVGILKCVAFSPDDRYLATVGLDDRKKEVIIVWDISRIHRGEKPERAARQTSDFNIICLKFSPIDNLRLVSCGQENIRFWRIRDNKQVENKNIRGSAVVLNHHARNSVFTSLDFEYGARAAPLPSGASLNPDSKENESLKRVFVASKHGLVYMINYLTEQVEAVHRTNDSEIHTISVNEAFCVTGSKDNYLRVWPHDFSEFYMEVKLEGTVCSTDISPDGLRVICGTKNGGLGMLDKSNQKYRTLMRAHTDSILSLDFHLAKRCIVTVSKDKTIRLWDMESFEQQIEFTCDIEQPLCVAAHPGLPIFSCGFADGAMRIFDIEKTCVVSEFTQFNKPLQKLAYSPNGELLVTCCQDGSVALHNARRQHLPTKMMHLEFPPQFVHVAFSPSVTRQKIQIVSRQVSHHDSTFGNEEEWLDEFQRQNQDLPKDTSNPSLAAVSAEGRSDILEGHKDEDGSGGRLPSGGITHEYVTESLFGIMGEYGNNVMIYDTDSIVLKHQIQAGHILRQFQFTRNAAEIVLVTKDQKLRFYSLSRFEGVFLRELQTVHRGSCLSMDLSLNGGFMLTGGEDNLMKVWDYDAQKTAPYFYQSFIGHTYPVNQVMFNPLNNNVLFSSGEKDGIYIWQFHGDTQTNFHREEEGGEKQMIERQVDRDALHEPTVLEKMREAVKEKKKPKLEQYSFFMPQFMPTERIDHSLASLGKESPVDPDSVQAYYDKVAEEKGLPCNQFISVKEKIDIKVNLEQKISIAIGGEGTVLEPEVVNGYDGFGGVHDNLVWTETSGFFTYTLNNKLIHESLKQRDQHKVLYESTVRLSCLASVYFEKTKEQRAQTLVAVAEGEPAGPGEQAKIFIYNMEKQSLVNKLAYHEKGVQSLHFMRKGQFLVSLGTYEGNDLAVWDIAAGRLKAWAQLQSKFTSKIISFDQNDEYAELKFATFGAQGSFTLWEFNEHTEELIPTHVELPSEDMKKIDFISGCFTQNQLKIGGRQTRVILLGDTEGKVYAYDYANAKFLYFGMSSMPYTGQITHIVSDQGVVVFATSQGAITLYKYINNDILMRDNADKINFQTLQVNGTVTSMQYNEKRNEGVCGTAAGNIFYFSFEDNEKVKLVSRVTPSPEHISQVSFDTYNPAVFLSTCGKQSGDVKLYSSKFCDLVNTFQQCSLGPAIFVIQLDRKNKKRMIGHEKGFLKIINLDSLNVDSIFQLSLNEGETLTCAHYNQSNVAIGTSQGAVYLTTTIAANPYSNNRTTLLSAARISGITDSPETAVTSVQMQPLTPDCSLLVAFDNGQVRYWKSTIKDKEAKLKDIARKNPYQGGKNKPPKYFDAIDFIDQMQFDVDDKFDMIEAHHEVNEELNGEYDREMNVHEGKSYPSCEAYASNLEQYICYCSNFQYIFIRNHLLKSVRRIDLCHSPTSLACLDLTLVASMYSLSLKGSNNLMMAVGTEEGKVIVYKLNDYDHKVVFKTSGGLAFGQVTSVSLTGGHGHDLIRMLAATQSGEIINFNLAHVINTLEQQ